MRAYFIFALTLLLLPIVHAATISGSVYDFSLNTVEAIVSIDSTPKQTMVAKDGSYSFTLPHGSYTLTAESNGETAEEQIEIESNGTFTVDLILLSTFDYNGIPELEITIPDEEKSNTTLFVTLGIIFLAILVILFFIVKKFSRPKDFDKEQVSKEEKISPKIADVNSSQQDSDQKTHIKVQTDSALNNLQTEDNLTKSILEFIKQQGSRTTQKDIRKHFPSSEAKISLILTQLEYEGKIQKVKKGRGNVIITK